MIDNKIGNITIDRSYRREAESDVQVLLHSIQVVVEHVLIGRWSPWKLLLHDRDQFLKDFVHLVSREEIRHLEGIKCTRIRIR